MKLFKAFIIAITVSQVTSFELEQNFRESKNIMFSAMMGGSSHINWVLSILEELSLYRNHSTFFITRDDQTKFGKLFPIINTHSVGPAYNIVNHGETIKALRHAPIAIGTAKLMERLISNVAEDYQFNMESMQSKEIDLAICDHFSKACVEAATTLKIPFIVTSSFPQGKDSGAPYINNHMLLLKNPTTENMSLKDRMHDMFIKPAQVLWASRKTRAYQIKLYKSLGLAKPTAPEERWDNSVKLFNTAFGIEPARPLGPLVELVGPIIPKTFADLTPVESTFLDSHEKVVFIAFGQHAVAEATDGQLILTALLEALEANDIDGIVWATRGISEMFPSFITTKSNTTYNISDLYRGSNANVLFLNWAPQMAILKHPSTNIFITHGGAGSLHEAFYAGKKIIVFPFFGDQPGAARMAERNGVGLFLDYTKSQQEANEVVRRVAVDEGGKMQSSVNRIKALVQIKAHSGLRRAADVIEEVLFTQVNTHLPYRWDVKRDMSTIKAYNLDIYAIVACFLGFASYLGFSLVAHVLSGAAVKVKTA